MRYYSYDEFIKDIKTLCHRLGKEYDAVIAVARGGLTIAHFLSECLGIREVLTINSIGYEDTKKKDRVCVTNIPDIEKYKKILLVDDIIDSGDTVKTILECLGNKEKITVVTLFYKPNAKVKPNISLHKADEWIDFFWMRDSQ